MNTKQKIALLKAALYFNAVIKEGKISKAAQKNGIKPGNLSRIISEFETAAKIPLLQRGNKGVRPTNYGFKIAGLVLSLEQKIEELEKFIKISPNICLRYHASPGIILNSLEDFQRQHPQWQLLPCATPQEAHLAILSEEPAWECEYTCLQTPGNISQKLWITCKMDNPEAVLFYDFIILQLLS